MNFLIHLIGVHGLQFTIAFASQSKVNCEANLPEELLKQNCIYKFFSCCCKYHNRTFIVCKLLAIQKKIPKPFLCPSLFRYIFPAIRQLNPPPHPIFCNSYDRYVFYTDIIFIYKDYPLRCLQSLIIKSIKTLQEW